MTSLTEILVGLPLQASILLKITIVLGASWFLHFILAKRNPHWRLLSWRCAITSLLLIPVLVPFSYLRISIPAPAKHSVIVSSETAFENSITETPLFSEAEPVQISQSEVSKNPQPSFLLMRWLQGKIWIIVLVGWGSVAIILILRLLAGFLQVRQKVMSSVQGPDHLQQLLDRVAEDLGSANKVTLRYTSGMSTPFLTGLLNPIIIIPDRMIAEKYENKMPAIFAHEVAHHTTISGRLRFDGSKLFSGSIRSYGSFAMPIVWHVKRCVTQSQQSISAIQNRMQAHWQLLPLKSSAK